MSYQFTHTADQILASAQKEAQRFNSEYIYPEHILLALCLEMSGIGATLFEHLKIDMPTVCRAVEQHITTGANDIRGGNLTFSAETMEILKSAGDCARKTGYHRIGTGHLWLGLLHQPDGTAATVFTDLGLESQNVRNTLLALLGTTNEFARESAPRETFNLNAFIIRLACWLAMMTFFGFIWQFVGKEIANITYPDVQAFLKHGTEVLTWKLHAWWNLRRIIVAVGFVFGWVTGEGLFRLINMSRIAGRAPTLQSVPAHR